jgi:hypothetical protein
MTQTHRQLRQFAALSLAVLCVAALVCGVFYVSQESGSMIFGGDARKVAVAFDPQTTTFSLQGQVTLKLPAGVSAVQTLRLLPAPLGLMTTIAAGVTNLLGLPQK